MWNCGQCCVPRPTVHFTDTADYPSSMRFLRLLLHLYRTVYALHHIIPALMNGLTGPLPWEHLNDIGYRGSWVSWRKIIARKNKGGGGFFPPHQHAIVPMSSALYAPISIKKNPTARKLPPFRVQSRLRPDCLAPRVFEHLRYCDALLHIPV